MRTVLVRPWLWLSLLAGSCWLGACGDQFTATPSGTAGAAEVAGESSQGTSGSTGLPEAGAGDQGGGASHGGSGIISTTAGVGGGGEQGGAPAVTASAYRQLVLDDKPLVYWRMGASKDRIVPDETGGGNDLVLQGTGHALGVQGAIEDDGDGAIEFDGKASFAIASNARVLDFVGGAKFSLECWAERQLGGASYFQHLFSNVQGVAGNRDGFALYLLPEPASGDSARSVFEYDRPAADLGIWGPVFGANLWGHYVAVFDGTQVSLYVNALASNDVTAGSIAARTVPFTVGRAAGVDGSYFKGALDELAIYPRALTSAEIAEHYSYARAP
jgi:hypothetical protein